MKKNFPLIILCLFVFGRAYTQTYNPIPADSVYWVEKIQGPYLGSECIESLITYIYPVENVLIGSHIYTKYKATTVVEHSYSGLPPSPCPPNGSTVSDYVYAYLRNDTLNKRVFFYDSVNLHADILLYDFNISTGDTIELINGYNTGCMEITSVGNIDSIDIGGSFRKRFEIISSDSLLSSFYLIEGIGSNYGLAYNNYCSYDFTYELICYHYKNFEYGNTASPYCTNTLSIPDDLHEAQNIFQYTGNNMYLVKIPEGQVQLTIFDLHGKILHTSTYHQDSYLDLSLYPSGVYFAAANANGLEYRPFKFVVSH